MTVNAFDTIMTMRGERDRHAGRQRCTDTQTDTQIKTYGEEIPIQKNIIIYKHTLIPRDSDVYYNDEDIDDDYDNAGCCAFGDDYEMCTIDKS